MKLFLTKNLLIIGLLWCFKPYERPNKETFEKSKHYAFDCSKEVKVFGGSIFQGDVFRGSFTSDGSTFYFFKKVKVNEEDYRIYSSTFKAGQWTIPKIVNLGGDYSNLYPSISKDGKTMVFTSYRPLPYPYKKNRAQNAHIWYSKKGKNGWGKPVYMVNANKIGYYHSWVEFGWDNNIYFRQTTPDWSHTQTFYTEWDGNQYGTPKVFKEVEQWKNWNKNVQIVGGSPGSTKSLIFLDVATIDSITGRRASDIWVSKKKGETWGDPQPLVNGVNESGYDVFPFFSPDNSCLFFIRDFNKIYTISLESALPKG